MFGARAANDGRAGRKRQENLGNPSEALFVFPATYFPATGKMICCGITPLMLINARGLIVKQTSGSLRIQSWNASTMQRVKALSPERGLGTGLGRKLFLISLPRKPLPPALSHRERGILT